MVKHNAILELPLSGAGQERAQMGELPVRCLTSPGAKPDLRRLPFFGRKALGHVILHIVWGEALSERVSRLLSRSADRMMARHAARQAGIGRRA